MLNRPKPPQSQNKPFVAGLDGRDGRYTKKFLYDHLRNANLHQQGSVNNEAKDLQFNSNEQFWESVLSSRYGARNRIGLRWVELNGFQLIDWFPRTPGLYHTPDAGYARHEAEHYVSEQNGILFYEPRGKTHMMQGGIGSVRFKPISIKDNDYWMCTATSDTYCHSGIPIAIPNKLMEKVDFNRLFKVVGQVRFLPEFLERYLNHMSGIPQIYVEVDNIIELGNEKKTSVKITPMVFFSAGREMGLDTKENVTYVTCKADATHELSSAIEWLEWYADRYDGKIITNFDQQEPIFANAPFSLQNVMNGKLDAYALERYHFENANIVCEKIENLHVETMNMTKIEVTLGDGTTIQGDFVVANSIKDSFNKVENANVSNELKSLLKDLAKSVATMSEHLPKEIAGQAARDLETLAAEATSKTPREKWWQLSAEGLTKAAKDIGEIGKPVLELAAKIVAILTVMPK
jgi:hypothetical protein